MSRSSAEISKDIRMAGKKLGAQNELSRKCQAAASLCEMISSKLEQLATYSEDLSDSEAKDYLQSVSQTIKELQNIRRTLD